MSKGNRVNYLVVVTWETWAVLMDGWIDRRNISLLKKLEK